MPILIEIDDEQEYSSSPGNNNLINNWAFNPMPTLEINYNSGDVLNDIDIATTIKNYIATVAPNQNSTFKVYVDVDIIGDSPFSGSDIVEIIGEIANATDGYEINETNLNVTTTLHFVNPFILLPGLHLFKLVFLVYEVDANNNVTFVENIYYPFRLNISTEINEYVQIDPLQLNFDHVLNENLPPAQALNITAPGLFNIKVDKHFELSGGNISFQNIEDNYKIYQGTGNQSVNLALTTEIEQVPFGVYTGLVIAYNSFLSPYLPTNVFVNYYETNMVSISSNLLIFEAIKNVSEAATQIIIIDGPGEVNFTCPNWLNCEIVNTDQYKALQVTPVLSANLVAGTYSGSIFLTINTIEFVVNVTHNVYENIQLNVVSGGLNFTKDFEGITRFYDTGEFQIEIILSITNFNYGFPSLPSYFEFNYLTTLLNNTTSFFIGKTLDNVMNELMKLEDINLPNFTNSLPNDSINFIRNYYNPSNVIANINFKHKTDTQLDYSQEFTDLLFIKGRKPKTPFNNSFILNYYLFPERVTPNSVALFNFYKTQTHQLRVYTNNELEKIINHVPGENSIFCYKHDFNNNTPGDIVEIKLYKDQDAVEPEEWYGNHENYIAQTYHVLPEGPQSYHIGWEDEYGVLKIIEFTGEFQFPLEYTNKTEEFVEEFHTVLKKIDKTKEQKLIANTGFVLKTDSYKIDSLYDAKRAWLIFKENQPAISLIPISKKLTHIDSVKELYDYTVEFKIIFNNDNKIY